MSDNPWNWLVPGEQKTEKGGRGSGFTGHVGIPGHRGGSAHSGKVSEAMGREALIHETANAIENLLINNPWGFSYRPVTGSPTSGNMVSLHPDEGHQQIMGSKDLLNSDQMKKTIVDYVRKRIEKVVGTPDLHFGGWQNDDDGNFYLDLSGRIHKKGDAWNLAKQNNQIAWYNIQEEHQYTTANMKPEDFTLDDFELTEPPDGVREKQFKGAYKMAKENGKKVGEVTVFPRPTGTSEEDIQKTADAIFNHISASLNDWFKRHYTDKGKTVEDYYTDYPDRRP